ncbi:hypothetical protein DY000_02044064 [Brassica cretica]|nr:hypothetical protein DY000_02044064 [Brassica cretica]
MSFPEYGKLMHLVKSSEKLTCLRFPKTTTYKEEVNKTEDKKIKKRELQWDEPAAAQVSRDRSSHLGVPHFLQSDLVLTATNLGL